MNITLLKGWVGSGRRKKDGMVCELPRLVEAGLPESKGMLWSQVWMGVAPDTGSGLRGSWCMCECVCVCAYMCSSLVSASVQLVTAFCIHLAFSCRQNHVSKCKYVLCWDCSLMGSVTLEQIHFQNKCYCRSDCATGRGAMCRSIWRSIGGQWLRLHGRGWRVGLSLENSRTRNYDPCLLFCCS